MPRAEFASMPGTLASLLIAAAGLIPLVGCSGEQYCLFCDGVQSPWIEVYVAAPPAVQVGESATFYANASAAASVQGPLAYQWCRSTDGTAACVEIADASSAYYTLVAANLGDAGAVFRATVRSGDTVGTAQATLHVSNTPPVVIEDGDFQPTDWSASVVAETGGTAPTHREERIATGGNPGSYLRVVKETVGGLTPFWVLYRSTSAVYDPARQGALYAVVFNLDTVSLEAEPQARERYVLPLIEQGGQRFVGYVGDWTSVSAVEGIAVDWLSVATYRIDSGAFRLAGVSCSLSSVGCSPDFSAGALPLTFGFAYYVRAPNAATVTSGIDNWKVTVFRR